MLEEISCIEQKHTFNEAKPAQIGQLLYHIPVLPVCERRLKLVENPLHDVQSFLPASDVTVMRQHFDDVAIIEDHFKAT